MARLRLVLSRLLPAKSSRLVCLAEICSVFFVLVVFITEHVRVKRKYILSLTGWRFQILVKDRARLFTTQILFYVLTKTGIFSRKASCTMWGVGDGGFSLVLIVFLIFFNFFLRTTWLVFQIISSDLCLHLKKCVYVLFPQCCLENTSWLQQVSSERIPNNPQVKLVLTDRHIFKQFISNTLTCSSLQSLVSELNIPRSLLLNFEIHLLYLRFAVLLQDNSVKQPLHALQFGVDDSDSENNDSSLDSTSEEDIVGDSDLEYW